MLPIYLFFTHKMPLYDFLTLILAFIALLGLLLFETEARQIVIKDGYIIERYYLVKEKKIKINEIKNCKITSGRQKGEALVNLKIIGQKRGQVININMIAYSTKKIKKICELIGFPEVIKHK